jgi:acetylornithine/N-succinyldiaminopimelate aminotransferase
MNNLKLKKEIIETENTWSIPFFDKVPLVVERGEGVYVWDEADNRYLDLTSGWGVTSIGHAHPAIVQALSTQSSKIIQNPNSGLTYSPARASLLRTLRRVLPANLTRIFFSNSGAEANDAAIKLARKATGKRNVISTEKSFHGRTISTASATGQSLHRDKFDPLMPNYLFVPFGDIGALESLIKKDVAAIILEPIQGEGGVNDPGPGYLPKVSALCHRNGVCLIMDEVQTGFFRTGPAFASDVEGVKTDFLTMAKGIAGGFPFGAFAVNEDISAKLEKGDHGGTFCGAPLGCAVADAVIQHMLDTQISENVMQVGEFTKAKLLGWQKKYPEIIKEVRGRGLLLALVFNNTDTAAAVEQKCYENRMLVNLKQGTVLRIFPALNIQQTEMQEGLEILQAAIENCL